MVLEVSRSGFYAWDKRPQSNREKENKAIMVQIKEIHKISGQTYGSRKITAALRRDGKVVNHKRVERLMREAGIRSKVARKFKATTNSKHSLPVAENILNREFSADRPNQKMVNWLNSRTAKILQPLKDISITLPFGCILTNYLGICSL